MLSSIGKIMVSKTPIATDARTAAVVDIGGGVIAGSIRVIVPRILVPIRPCVCRRTILSNRPVTIAYNVNGLGCATV